MPAFMTIVFLCGVAATLMFRGWLKGREAAEKARIAREEAQREQEEEKPTRGKRRKG